MSKMVSRDEFDAVCEEARAKYKDFEEKIKKVEKKVTGSVSEEYDLNNQVMFEKFIAMSYEKESMDGFIRSEFLNLIIARKKYVKEQKEVKKAAKATRQPKHAPVDAATSSVAMLAQASKELPDKASDAKS